MIQILQFKTRLLLAMLLTLFGVNLSAQTVTIGTGTTTNTNTGYPSPYGHFYWGARHQFLILGSEIVAAGGNAGNIRSLAFNVSASTTQQGLVTCTGFGLTDFTIKVKTTAATSLTTSFDEVGLTTVHGPLFYTDINGWNIHLFNSPIAWNPTQNLLVDVCFNNSCYNYNAAVFNSTTTFTSTAWRNADAAGNCTNTAVSSSTIRPNMRLEIVGAGGGPVLPPIANFFPSQATTTSIPTDTVWINSPSDLVSTSTNTSRAFWDLPGENPLLPGYGRTGVANTSQQYIDTAKYDSRFKYTFNRRGFWPVRLLAVNNIKRDSLRDSVVKYIYVDTPGTTPKPNFFAARRKVGIGDYASLVDITSGGPNQWFWTFDPPCNLCTTPPY
ncbi:MAG: hypothetical protein Q8R57_07030, partial [Bacteroidota bacterium]|nr:hypothetical protein [Bacteroidota bacterium]